MRTKTKLHLETSPAIDSMTFAGALLSACGAWLSEMIVVKDVTNVTCKNCLRVYESRKHPGRKGLSYEQSTTTSS